MMDSVPLLVICALLALGAWHDLATRTIPDTVSAGTALIGIVVRGAEGWHPALMSLLTAAVLLMVLLPLTMHGLFGGGDVKLLTALALGWSPSAVVQLLLAITCCGSVVAGCYVVMRRLARLWPPPPTGCGPGRGTLLRVLSVERRRLTRPSSMPYGVAIAFGVFFFVATSARV